MNKYDYIEILCKLHGKCNLQCKFCCVTDNGIHRPNKINIDYIRNLHNEIIDSIRPNIKKYNVPTILLALMGGELFSDDIPDEVFDDYRNFILNLTEKLNQEFGINVVINIISNGVFTKRERVEKFLKDLNIKFLLSYDPCDRFHNNQKQIWLDTVEYFKKTDIDLWLSIVLTKPNIDAYINGDEAFNSIPQNIFVEVMDYSPRIDYNDHLPNDDDYYNFYKWCIDNEKFNVRFIGDIFRHSYRICNTRAIYYFFSQPLMAKYGVPYITKCTEDSPICVEEYYGEYSNQILDVHDCVKYKQPSGLHKRGCLYCEYHGKCPEMCSDLVLLKGYQMTECPIKRTYKYIEDNPSLMDRYNEWRDKYECNKQV